MQNSVPKGKGGMVAVLGSTVETIEKILKEKEKNFTVAVGSREEVRGWTGLLKTQTF